MATDFKPHTVNMPQVDRDDVTDEALLGVIERAEVTKSPPISWYLTMGNNPDVAVGFAKYWELTHRNGTVPHDIKELCRIQIAQMIRCDFCASQRSPLATGVSEEDIQSCALPDWNHPDPKTNAALHYARTLTLDDGRDDEVYAELEQFYSRAEIIEMAAFFCFTAGGNRMAKSWGIDPHLESSAIPEGALSIHD